MTAYIITRHPGAIEWLRHHYPELGIAKAISHASEDFFAGLEKGDVVIGVLPLALAARVCDAGARFYSLSVPVPPEMRGKELSADDLERLGASIEEAVVIMGDSLKKARGQGHLHVDEALRHVPYVGICATCGEHHKYLFPDEGEEIEYYCAMCGTGFLVLHREKEKEDG